MKIVQVKKRSVVFTQNLTDWDLNVHLILGNKNNYLIDTGLGSLSMVPVKEYLKDSPLPLIVINTHHHWDHIWGNVAFESSTIISHALCRQIAENQWYEMSDKHKQYIAGENPMVLPNLVFDNSLYFPEDKIYLFHTPGHTADGISVFDEIDGVLNVGDNIGDSMDEIVPSLDEDKEIYIETLCKYKKLDFNTCVSGHNIVLTKGIIETIEKSLL